MKTGIKNTHQIIKFVILAVIIIVLVYISVIYFPTKLSLSSSDFSMIKNILLKIRCPEILTALISGAILGLSGCLMQTVLNNPLASPFTLGTSSSAAFGAALAISGIFPGLTFLGTSICAFLFSLLSIGILLLTVNLLGINQKNMVIGGIAVNFMFSAGNSLLQYFSTSEKLYEMTFWTYGSLSISTYKQILELFVLYIIAIIISFLFSNDLGAIASGEKQAVSSGVNVNKTRIIIMLICTFLSAVSVCIIGVIGFVGLVAPHFSRLIGIKKPSRIIFSSSMIGAILLILADTIAKVIVKSVMLPIGAITSILGIPFLIILAFFQRKKIMF